MSSGAIIPARAPASMDMLQIVMRPSIESARIAAPRYSMTAPWPPLTPIRAMMPRITSFADTPVGRAPSTVTAIVFGRRCQSVCVARTCSTSLVPMPHASVPNAPCVDVWLSPHTIVIPGSVRPSCGEITCTIPWSGDPIGYRRTPNSAALRAIASICLVEISSGGVAAEVGTLWSIVASTRSGRRTRRPRCRSPSNACGEVTSCTRWRSM